MSCLQFRNCCAGKLPLRQPSERPLLRICRPLLEAVAFAPGLPLLEWNAFAEKSSRVGRGRSKIAKQETKQIWKTR
jgi:hypothetical protein